MAKAISPKIPANSPLIYSKREDAKDGFTHNVRIKRVKKRKLALSDYTKIPNEILDTRNNKLTPVNNGSAKKGK